MKKVIKSAETTALAASDVAQNFSIEKVTGGGLSTLPNPNFIPFSSFGTNEDGSVTLGVSSGIVKTPLPVGTKLTLLLTFPVACRYDGVRYTDKCYGEKNGISGSSVEAYYAVEGQCLDDETKEAMKARGWSLGYVHMFAYKPPEKDWDVSLIEMIGSKQNYLAAVLSLGQLHEGKAIELRISNFQKHLKTSKNNFKYLSPYKWSVGQDFEALALTKDDFEEIKRVWQSKISAIQRIIEL